MFVLLLIGVATLVYVSLDVHRMVVEARMYRQAVYEAMEKTECQILDTKVSGNILLVRAKNTGELPIALTRVALFVDGFFVGRCGDINCADASGNGVVSPGEDFNVTTTVSSPPSRVLVAFGPVTCARYP